ncbi:MAG: prolyl oligopeptidase family serine peptidase [Acidobacteriota bacterium]
MNERCRCFVVCALLACSASLPASTGSSPDAEPVPIPEILLLGPVSTPLGSPWPGEFKKDAQLGQLVHHLSQKGLPAEGDEWAVFGTEYSWQKVPSVEGLFALPADSQGLWIASLNLEAGRWISASLQLQTPGQPHLFLDGKPVALSALKDAPQDSPAHSANLKMIPGSHRLLLLAATEPDADAGGIRLELEASQPDFAEDLKPHVRAERLISARQLSDAPDVSSLNISPDGQEILLSIRSRDTVLERWQTTLEVRRFDDGSLLRRWQAASPGRLQWSPDGKWISYTASQEGKADLWLHNRSDGSQRRLLQGLEGLGSYRWAPDSRSIFFHWTRPAEKRKDGLKRYQGLPDRWSSWRDRAQIFQVDAQSGWIQQLTQGEWSSQLQDVMPGKLLFSQQWPDSAQPPYMRHALKELSLSDGKVRDIHEFWSFEEAAYSGGHLIIIRAGPTAFDGLGAAVAEGQTPNDYDTQLYKYHLESGQVKCLSRDFDPSIDSMEVDPARRLVLLRALDGTQVRLFRLELEEERFTPLATEMAVVESFTYARQAGRWAWKGTSPLAPQRVYRMDWTGRQPRMLLDPASDAYRQTRLGEVESWNFTSSAGDTIAGRFYTPARFDPSRKYPLIVYYYGGTVPVSDQFSSRYPWNLWAANGYVVYVLQPSGAIGFGQEFSARHVNAWGGQTSDEILQGTRRFIQAHPFVDPGRVGCIGASYGGFMTMYLITRSDLFAAAISHAGISSLASYWGQGWWGYLYSGVASRGSFPWNRPDFYVEHSPLFQADRITTPLLLLHGDADTNVPVGESHQMYTALKLLDKEVELVTVEGQNHHILDYDKRLAWWNTILAWFDKHLKEQPQWWEETFGE